MSINKGLNILNIAITECYMLLTSIKQMSNIHIPYFSQWENRKMVDDIISNKKSAQDDISWKNSGATSRKEYELWSWNMCGMACLKMILKKTHNNNYRIIELGKEALKYGVYKLNGKDIDGLFYQPFCNFIKKDFNLESECLSFCSFKRILYELNNNNIPIASVSPLIRYAHKTNKNKKVIPGGHLVIVTGYNKITKKIYINNPSGLYKKSQENVELEFNEFKKYFAHKGIIVKN